MTGKTHKKVSKNKTDDDSEVSETKICQNKNKSDSETDHSDSEVDETKICQNKNKIKNKTCHSNKNKNKIKTSHSKNENKIYKDRNCVNTCCKSKDENSVCSHSHEFCVDSGCTCHMTDNLELLSDVEEMMEVINVAKKDQSMSSLGVGNVRTEHCDLMNVCSRID